MRTRRVHSGATTARHPHGPRDRAHRPPRHDSTERLPCGQVAERPSFKLRPFGGPVGALVGVSPHAFATTPVVAAGRRGFLGRAPLAARSATRYSKSMKIRHKGTAGAARAGQSGSATGGSGATASTHSTPAARSDASRQCGCTWFSVAPVEGWPRGPMERARIRQLARSVPLRGRRGRGCGPGRLPLIGRRTEHERHRQQACRSDAEPSAPG